MIGFVLKLWLYGFPIEIAYDMPMWKLFDLHFVQKKYYQFT